MSNTKSLVCANCNNDFEYSTKEYTRQTKKGRTRFFCSLSCGAKWNNKHRSEETQRKMSAALSVRSIGNQNAKKGKFTYYLNKAKHRGFDYDLDDKFLENLWNKQEHRCAITRVPLHLKKGKHVLNTASLDRIDSTKGYTKDNVQFVSYGVNLAKNTFTNQEVLSFISEIKRHA